MRRLIMGAGLSVVILCLITPAAFATRITQRYQFSEPIVEENAPYVRIRMEDTRPVGAPGEPLIPARALPACRCFPGSASF
jgi:hypothetical protein